MLKRCVSISLTVDILLVSLESVHLLHGPDVIHLDQMVPGCCQQPVPILVPVHRHHSRFVGMAVCACVERGEGGEGRRREYTRL